MIGVFQLKSNIFWDAESQRTFRKEPHNFVLVFLKQSIYKSVSRKTDLNKRLVIRCCFRDLYSLRKIIFSNIKRNANVNYSVLVQIRDKR